MIEVIKIKDKEIYLKCLPWFNDISFTDMTSLDCLTRCLTGQYEGALGLLDGKPIGLMIYQVKLPMCFIVGVWCRKNLDKFTEKGFEYLKQQGIVKVRCLSDLHDYEEKADMKKLWSVYEREL